MTHPSDDKFRNRVSNYLSEIARGVGYAGYFECSDRRRRGLSRCGECR